MLFPSNGGGRCFFEPLPIVAASAVPPPHKIGAVTLKNLEAGFSDPSGPDSLDMQV